MLKSTYSKYNELSKVYTNSVQHPFTNVFPLLLYCVVTNVGGNDDRVQRTCVPVSVFCVSIVYVCII